MRSTHPQVLRLYRLAAMVALAVWMTLPWAASVRGAESDGAGGDIAVPILVYHRFGSVAADNMTVTTAVFESHLEYLRGHGYTVISLSRLIACFRGNECGIPRRSVVITVDDGHRSVFGEMLPLVKRYRVPVTVFVYPSAISNASYAMTWEQLGELKETGLFDIQSHSFWHPNFRKEKQRLSPREYDRFVQMQLTKSRTVIENRLRTSVDMIAWPFGICDDGLIAAAKKAGYVAGFTLQRKPATRANDVMALPRFLMTDSARGKAFERIVSGG